MDGRHQASARRFELTERQEQVVRLIAEGRTNHEIAVALGISLEGAKYHVREVMAKYGVESREDAVAAWLREQSLRSRLGRRLRLTGGTAALRWASGVAAAGMLVAGLFALSSAAANDNEQPEVSAPAATPTPVPLGAVVATIPVGFAPASIAAGEGAVWVAMNGAGDVVRIDPATNQIVARIPVGYRFFHVAAGLGAVWVTSGDAREVLRINPSTNQPVATIPLYPEDPEPSIGTRLAIGPDSLWVLDRDGRTVLRIDPATNSVAATIPIESETLLSAITVDRNRVWVLSLGGELIRIDAHTNQVNRTVHDFERTGVVAIAASPDGFWLSAGADRSIGRLHPVSQSVLRIAAAPVPGPLLLTDDSVWVIVGRGQAGPGGLMRLPLNAGPGTKGRVIDVGPEPFAIAAGEGGIWIADLSGTSVWRIDPTIDGPESTHDFEAIPPTPVAPS